MKSVCQLPTVEYVAPILLEIKCLRILEALHLYLQFFPKNIKKKESNEGNQINRYSRLLRRQTSSIPELSTCTQDTLETLKEHSYKSIGVQESLDDNLTSNFLFYCTIEGNNIGTMAQLSYQNVINETKKAHKSCGPSSSDLGCSFLCDGFYGFSSISNNEEGLRHLTGLSSKIFNFFFKIIPKSVGNQMCEEDRILLFMMKIKLGLTYSALSVLFKIHRTTAQRIFVDILTLEW